MRKCEDLDGVEVTECDPSKDGAQSRIRNEGPHTHPLTPSLPWEENKATFFLCFQAETIGDTYMVASGLPIRNGIRHVDEIAMMSLHFLGATIHFQMGHMPEEKLKLRLASTQVDSTKGRWPCGPDTAADGSKFNPRPEAFRSPETKW